MDFYVPSEMLDEFLFNVFRRITVGSVGNELLKDLCWNKIFFKNYKELVSISLLFYTDITVLRLFNGPSANICALWNWVVIFSRMLSVLKR